MLTFRTSNRGRYAKVLRHMFNHPEKYDVFCRGKDYGATDKDPTYGCGWYIDYFKLS